MNPTNETPPEAAPTPPAGGLEEFLRFAKGSCRKCFGSGVVGYLLPKIPARRAHPRRMGEPNALSKKVPFIRGGGITVEKQLCGCAVSGYAKHFKEQQAALKAQVALPPGVAAP
jgi:hypothetical protein